MPRRLVPLFLALAALLAAPPTFAKPRSAQKTIQAHPAVHYFLAKPTRAAFT